jgi:protein-tyrosine phosphatase
MDEFSVSVVMAPDGGQIAIAPIPGRSGDFEADLCMILAWRPELVISLTTLQEFSETSEMDFSFFLHRENIDWIHLPIPDHGTPDPQTEAEWTEVSTRVRRLLTDDGHVLIHCRAGQGRSGMMAMRLLVEMGLPPESALERVRTVRPHAVETTDQFAWAAKAWKTE